MLLELSACVSGLCRRHMRAFRWGLLSVLVGLHLVMKAPVWALIARIDLTGSSSGYHRFMLVDGCIRHFSEWWLFGFKNYDQWGWDMWDLSNQYVAYAITGGLVITGLIHRYYRSKLWTAWERRGGLSRETQNKNGFCGASALALLSHVVAYFGIGYFDQMQFAWFALLAIISVAVFEVMNVIGDRKFRSVLALELRNRRLTP